MENHGQIIIPVSKTTAKRRINIYTGNLNFGLQGNAKKFGNE